MSTPTPQVTPSVVRTIVPLIVGFLVTQALRLGVTIDSATLSSIVTPLIAAVYYIVARALETHVSPSWGKLLGVASQPHYT